MPSPDTTTGVDVDLDLDLATPATRDITIPPDTQPMGEETVVPPPAPPKWAAPAPAAMPAAAPAKPAVGPMEFDLSGISLDLDKPLEAGPSSLPPMDDGSDPLSRKLELADEFRQIGDVEGARDLLQEVIAKGDGALKARAQRLLEDLS
jgi:pilus assembly protein FimV